MFVHALLFTLILASFSFIFLIVGRLPERVQALVPWFLSICALAALSGAAYFAFDRVPTTAAGFVGSFVILALFMRGRFSDWDARGHAFFLAFLASLVAFLAYDLDRIVNGHLTAVGIVLSGVLFSLEAGSALLGAFYAFEVLNVMCRVVWRRRFMPVTFATGYHPKVCIQVPAHSEPVEMVQQTLEAIAAIDYPNYEVIMVDDNTTESELWRPLMDFCHEKGFKVFHLQDYPGFKSGALNFALTQTDAEIIAVVDSDYLVRPEYLRECVPHFQNPAVAFVQTPQSFHNLDGYPFRENAALAQRYFFEVGMASRNERNSIIFCGTMGLIRRRVLEEIGGWSEWCITEDAEASLRILSRGYESVFINQVYGSGLVPETFEDTKKQRFRWAFGGVQILRRYWSWILPFWRNRHAKGLTAAQRLDYFAGLLGWFNDLLILAFTLFILVTAVSYALGFELPVRRLLGLALIVPIMAIFTGTLRVGWALRMRTGCSWRMGMGAFLSMLSLSWTIGQACISGIIHSKGVFLRTPKDSDESDLAQALRVTRGEALLGVALVVGVVGLLNVIWSFESVLLAVLLLWHSLVYLSAVRSSLTDSQRAGA